MIEMAFQTGAYRAWRPGIPRRPMAASAWRWWSATTTTANSQTAEGRQPRRTMGDTLSSSALGVMVAEKRPARVLARAF